MKKNITFILTLLAVLFLFGSAFAEPDQVSIVPISKWNYKNVNGWGFYAKGGEYSWFGFILRNPSDTEYTVTLPIEVNVANNTTHKIVNTSYKAMVNGSVDFLYEGYKKVYFNNSFTLPKDSTYSVFFDVTDMQRYSRQWDTDIFFSLQIQDQNTSLIMPIKGVLAYDAKNTTPSKLTIVTPTPDPVTPPSPLDPLTATAFCRDYNASNKKVSFSYSLKNNSTMVIPVELATSLAIEGQSSIAAVKYTGCTSGGSDCASRISKGIFKLNPGETAQFKGEATLSANPAKTDFYIHTSLRYDYNGLTLIPFLVGYSTNSCTASPVTPVPTATPPVPPVITVTPDPGENEGGLISVKFCRGYNSKDRKVTFSYTLKNSSAVTIPVELAQSLAVEGFQNIIPVRYTGCARSGSSCSISGGTFNMNAGETVEFQGEATLPFQPSKSNFYIRTSLRYDLNGKKLIPFLVGYASYTCSASPSEPTVIPGTDEGELVNVSFCRNYDATARKVSFSYALKNKSSQTIPVELATTLAVGGFNQAVPISYTGCTSGGSSCMSRIRKGIFKLNPGETAEFKGTATLPSQPANENFFIKTSLRYDFNGRKLIPFLVGYTTNSCSAAHAVSADEIIQKSSESGDPLKVTTRIVNDRDTEMTVLPGAVIRGEAAFGYYEGIASISAVDVEITGHRDVTFINDEAFILPPYSIAEVTISLTADPAMLEPTDDETLTWNYSINGTKGSSELNGTEAKGLTLSGTGTTVSDDPMKLYRIDSPQKTPAPKPIPNFEPKP